MSLFAPANVSDKDSAPRAPQESRDPLASNHNPQAQVNPSSELGLQFLSEGGMLSALAKVVMDSVGADGIALAYAVDGVVACRASCGNHAPPVGTPVNLNSGIGAQCLRDGKTVTCSDTETDPRVNKNVCRAIGVRSMLAAPLRRNGQVIGVAQAFYSEANGFSEAAMAELEASSELFLSCIPGENSTDGQPAAVPDLEVVADPPPVAPQVAFPRAEVSAVIAEPASHAEKIGPLAASSVVSETEKLSPKRPEEQKSHPGLNNKKIYAAQAPEKPQPPETAPAIFAQIQEPVWWKRPTVVATAVCALGVLLWAGAREVSRSTSAGTTVESRSSATAQLEPNQVASMAQLLKQAQSGDSRAQYNLAQRFETGNGILRDLPKAYAWYIVAGEAGNDSAKQAIRSLTPKLTTEQIADIRFDVGKMYASGVGVRRRDNVAAYKWFVLADAAGDGRARNEQKKLAASMRPKEIAEAESRASAWLSGRRSPFQLVKSANR